MKIISIKCSHCGKEFRRRSGQYNEAIKFGWRQFCSLKCRDAIRRESIEKRCGNPDCDKKITCSPRQIRKSISGKFYCSHFCSAKINNLKRKNKFPDHPCANCGKLTHWIKKYCSRKCVHVSKRMTTEQFKISVVNKIQEFCLKNNRIPTKREMYGTYGTARAVFGTWNKAIEIAGFKPNPVMFAHHFEARDGHKCDSFTEKVIDDWLFENKIDHQVHVPYPRFPEFRSDFVVNGIFIEFFGLDGKHKKYSELAKRKRELAQKHGVRIIEIYPKDIYPKNNLGVILKDLVY